MRRLSAEQWSSSGVEWGALGERRPPLNIYLEAPDDERGGYAQAKGIAEQSEKTPWLARR